MARAASGDDSIAIVIETSYDGAGLRAARADNSALGREARAAAQQVAASAQQSAAAERDLAAAARDAAASQDMVRISSEKAIELERIAGGNKQKLLELLRQYVAEQKALAAATATATAEMQRQAAAGSGVGGVAPGVLNAGTVGAVSKVSSEVDKIPTKARTAANALSAMAFSITAGAGSAQGLTVAAGTAAASLAALTTSARVAAAASGIGAVVTVLSTLMLLLDKTDEKTKTFGMSLNELADRALEMRRAMIDSAVAQQTQLVAELERSRRWFGVNWGLEIKEQQEKLDRLLEEQASVFQEQLSRRRAAGRESAELLRNAHDELVVAQARLEIEELRTAQLHQQTGVVSMERKELMTLAADERSIRERALDQEEKAQERAIRQRFEQRDATGQLQKLTAEQLDAMKALLEANRQLTQEKREQLVLEEALADAKRREELRLERAKVKGNLADETEARLAQIELERQAEIQRTGDEAEANAMAQLKKRKVILETVDRTKGALGELARVTLDSQNKTAIAIGHGADTLRKLMIGAEGAYAAVQAAVESGKAIGSAASGDIRGAALHSAAAVQFGAAAAMAFREAGGGGSPGAGGAGGGFSGSMSTHDPRDSGGQNITVVIQTVDPTSKTVMNEVLYYLQRQGILKRPMGVSPGVPGPVTTAKAGTYGAGNVTTIVV